MFSCEFCEISKNTVFYRTLPVAASKPFEKSQEIKQNKTEPENLDMFMRNI